MSAKIVCAREFEARKLAIARIARAGHPKRAKQAHRLAARLYHAGASVDRAAREAATTIAKHGGV